MPKPVSYTPPHAATGPEAPADRPVARRHVFYLPGYDPEAATRYRLLFRRELGLYAKRFGGSGRRLSGRAAPDADARVQSWGVGAHPRTGGAELRYDVLLWDDLVARDLARPRRVTLALVARATLHMLAAGALPAMARTGWKCACIVLWPFLATVLLGATMAAVGALAYAGLALALPAWPAAAAGVAAGLALGLALRRLLEFLYYSQLSNDLVFNWQYAVGRRPDYDAALDRFVETIRARLDAAWEEDARPDEVLIVGHSTGALTAVEVAARLLDRDARLGTGGQSLSLATLGSGLPVVALQPAAARVRADIARLVTCPRLAWVDYVAPQDWLNFPRFNPIHDLALPLGPDPRLVNPTIRSARFREIIDGETYARVRFRPFRMHFQFLMANDRPGAYDFFAMILGPLTLRERARDRTPERVREPAVGSPAPANGSEATAPVRAA